MSGPVTVNGVVLLTAPVGEYDKRVVLLTRERGKITAFARGARKSTSALLAAANPFVFAAFQVYEGRSAYSLVAADVSHHFTELAREQPGVYYGFYFLEFLDYYGREGVDGADMVNLLYVALRGLENLKIPDRLVRRVFELKLMALNGEYPQVFACVRCGKKESPWLFSLQKSGVLCADCCGGDDAGIPISDSLLYTMQYVIASPIGKLYSFTVTDAVLREFEQLMDRYLDVYTDKKFKSLEILKMMC